MASKKRWKKMKKNIVLGIMGVVTMLSATPRQVYDAEMGYGLEFPIFFWAGMIVLLIAIYGITESFSARGQKNKNINSVRKTQKQTEIYDWMVNGDIF